ncbi:hypothetical protein Esi_0117_0074 [Ectocarpus siliculosus]|uniref:Uncharacterized protein n=1 Tax=Ectocarpus siliculosus TaxID=2880 RepID=D7FI58_ECTSI|nr:hypothetical protein Esi_0117_0074 [Ectocarpus siliculosus]|eukprot:CBJ28684.1 hypothetical protein Esi_0117_0074 [Ectocarpus siliculosus]
MLNVSPTTLLGRRRTTTHQVWVRWASQISRGAAARFSGELYKAERNQ